MYGLPQSPRDCGITRDLAITDTQITVPAAKARERGEVTEEGVPPDVAGKPLVLRPSAADSQVPPLRVLVSDGNTAGPWVAVYVDDVFIMGPVLLARLGKLAQCNASHESRMVLRRSSALNLPGRVISLC